MIDLGEQYLQGSFVKVDHIMPPLRRLPTQLVRCDVTQSEGGCGLLQLAHTFPPDILYSNYWYRSGTNATMRDHLRGIVEDAIKVINRSPQAVLDIGCNDGTLLSYYPAGCRRYGIDPSDIASEVAGDATIINTIFPSEQALAVLGEGDLDIVTSIAMFYDLEDPRAFAREVTRLLRPDGIWVFEMSYLPLMLLLNSFDTICHEHVEYYSLAVLEYIVQSAGLRIFKAEINDINGGSIRCYACHADNRTFMTPGDRQLLQQLRIREFEMELDTNRPYADFNRRINGIRENLVELLIKIREQSQTVHIYGASTKGNVILQWCGINRLMVECAAERNPDKFGAKTLGTNIPIVSEEESRKLHPDYYLVLPWHFRREFLQRERDTILNGTKMIFPLPTVQIIDANNYEEAVAQAAINTEAMQSLLFSRAGELE